jgi:hypothetical protein
MNRRRMWETSIPVHRAEDTMLFVSCSFWEPPQMALWEIRAPALAASCLLARCISQSLWQSYNIKLWVSSMSLVRYWELSNVSANITVAIHRVNFWGRQLNCLPKRWTTPNIRHGTHRICQYMFTLRMATAMFTETLGNSWHSTQFIPESRILKLNASRENLR